MASEDNEITSDCQRSPNRVKEVWVPPLSLLIALSSILVTALVQIWNTNIDRDLKLFEVTLAENQKSCASSARHLAQDFSQIFPLMAEKHDRNRPNAKRFQALRQV